MNISSTKPVSLPTQTKIESKVEPESIYEKAWETADKVQFGLSRSGDGLKGFMACGLPVIGLKSAGGWRKDMETGRIEKTNLQLLTNTATLVGQSVGLGSAALSLISALSGIGPAGSLLALSGAGFLTAGVAGFTAAAVEPKHFDKKS